MNLGWNDKVLTCRGGADHELNPIRGQTLHVHAPYIKHAFQDYSDPTFPVYIYPRQDHVLIGGTVHPGSSDRTPSEEHTEAILAKAAKFFPQIRSAPLLRVVVGIRPGRSRVRLEAEDLWVAAPGAEGHAEGDQLIRVVHNYGHGGAGWTLHWGCAIETVDLALEGLTRKSPLISRL